MNPRTDTSSALFDDADLVVDRIYRGGRAGNSGDDRLSKLLGVSNQGGFRYRGTLDDLKFVVVLSSLSDPDWPDGLDRETGVFTYFGDNKTPGCELHGTPRKGNEILRRVFALAHDRGTRGRVPPILVFANAGTYRDVQFLGLAVPGARGLASTDDLVAIWRTTQGQRFQNYRAFFTILDVDVVSRAWLDAIVRGTDHIEKAPPAWRQWVASGNYRPLLAPSTVMHRGKAEQLPGPEGMAILKKIHQHFAPRPTDFEHFAARVAQWMDPNIVSIDVTRPSRDGGRDAIGRYRIGSDASAIHVDFAMEAKCYKPGMPVGVKDVARLISRLRHRQFGILVTTSYLGEQAYEELTADRHPVCIVSGADLVQVLTRVGALDSGVPEPWSDSESTLPSRNAKPTAPRPK